MNMRMMNLNGLLRSRNSNFWSKEKHDKMKKKVRCLCCGYRTLDERGCFDICPVCFWEDDCYFLFDEKDENGIITSIFNHNNCNDADYFGEDVIDIPSGANHSLTLRQGRANYQEFGACEKEMLQHCRKPRKSEMK